MRIQQLSIRSDVNRNAADPYACLLFLVLFQARLQSRPQTVDITVRGHRVISMLLRGVGRHYAEEREEEKNQPQ